MEMKIFSIDPWWAGIFFAFYVGFSVFFGVLVYLALTKPSIIRAEYRCLFEPISKKSAMICAVITMLPFTVYGYWDCWKYYYTLSLRDNKLIVTYLFPNRKYEISDLGSLKVATETEARKGLIYRIKLMTEERIFISQQMTRKEFEVNHQILTQKIQKRTDLTRPVEQ